MTHILSLPFLPFAPSNVLRLLRPSEKYPRTKRERDAHPLHTHTHTHTHTHIPIVQLWINWHDIIFQCEGGGSKDLEKKMADLNPAPF